jgi:hypothetical protein
MRENEVNKPTTYGFCMKSPNPEVRQLFSQINPKRQNPRTRKRP